MFIKESIYILRTDIESICKFKSHCREYYQNKKKTQCPFHIHCSLIPQYKNTSFCQVYVWWKPGNIHSRQSLQFSEFIAYYLSCVLGVGQLISITLVYYLQNVDMSSLIYVWFVFVFGLCLLIHNMLNGKGSV